MKRTLRYLKPYTGKLILAMLAISVATLCDLLLPTLMSEILNKGISAQDFDAILSYCLQMLLLAATSLGCIIVSSKLSSNVVAAFCADVRREVFAKVNTLSFEEFGALGTAPLVTRATHDAETLSWVASMLCGTVATIPMLFFGGVILAMSKDVVLAAILLAFIPIILFAVLRIGRKVKPLWEESDHYIDLQNGIMRERLRGIRVIRAFRSEGREQQRIAEATERMATSIIKGNVAMGAIQPLSLLVLNFAIVLIVYFGGWRMANQVSAVSAGDIFAVIQYVILVMNGVVMASFAIVMYPHAKVAAGRIGQVFDARGTGDPHIGLDQPLAGDIRFDHVSFSYGGDQNAVDDVSLHIRPGQKVSVIGGTGSGKSTLVSLLLGFRAPTEGRLYFDGTPAGDISKHALRRDISSVLQGSAIYSGTIAENIRMGNPSATDEDLEAAARIAQLSDYLAECDGGLQHTIHQAGKNLSGGQKQRLSIARAIVKDAPIYIFDDSFSALDFLTEKNLRAALARRMEGRTQIVVTQRVTSAMNSDCIFVMDRGRLIDQGRHEELLSRCKIYQEIFASQTGGGSK